MIMGGGFEGGGAFRNFASYDGTWMEFSVVGIVYYLMKHF
jgi:hypothetical protein